MYIKPHSDPKLVVDVRGADSKPGAKVILYTDKGDLADNQLWYEDERGVVRSKMNGFAVDTSGYLVSFFVWAISLLQCANLCSIVIYLTILYARLANIVSNIGFPLNLAKILYFHCT